jgi:hypothetical protein
MVGANNRRHGISAASGVKQRRQAPVFHLLYRTIPRHRAMGMLARLNVL